MMKLGLRLLLVLSLSLNAGLLGVGIYRAVAQNRALDDGLAGTEAPAEAPPDVASQWPAEAAEAPTAPAPLTPQEPAIALPSPEPPLAAAQGRDAAAHRRAWERVLQGRPGAPVWAARQWPWRRVGRLDRALHLTAQQRRELERGLVPLHAQIQAISAQLAQARALLMAQLAADRVDAAVARALQARLSLAQARLDSLVTEAMLREQAVLDPRQRQIHAQMLRAMAADHSGRHARLRSPAPMQPASEPAVEPPGEPANQ